MANKLKHFVRLDSKNEPVLASNIARRKKPVSGKWLRIFPPNCCNDLISYTPLDLTSATGIDFVLSCDEEPIMTTRLLGTTTNITDFVARLNTNLGALIQFYALGTSVEAAPSLDAFGSLCSGQLSFTAEAV